MSAKNDKPSYARGLPTQVSLVREQIEREIEEKKGQHNIGDILREYGIYPLAALATVAAVSKEFVFLNEEFLLAVNFWGIVFLGTVYASGPIHDYLSERRIERYKRLWGWDDFSLDRIEAEIREKQLLLSAPEIYREYQQEFNEAAKAMAVYERVKPRHEARAIMLKRLNEIKTAEEEIGKTEREKLVKNSLEYVKSKFLGDANLRKQSITAAIANLGKAPTKGEQQPIVDLYNEFLKKEGKSTLNV